MKFGCMSCGAKYSVPDGRLEEAGPQGLRIRCSRCRAIMVVSESTRFNTVTPPHATPLPSDEAVATAADDDEDTRKELRHGRRGPPPQTISTDSLQASSFSSSDGVPAALSASGVFRPMPGVHRQVTGLYFPDLDELAAAGKPVISRAWYAAIDARPRGPFSAPEMVSLAEKGKIRDSTLVWRPGFSTWKQVRAGEDGNEREDLSWLRRVVRARKLREREAQRRAEQMHGIKPISLTRMSSGRRPSALVGNTTGLGLPPPLPDDAGGLDDLPMIAEAVMRDPSMPWRADELRPLAALGTRRNEKRSWPAVLITLAFVASVVVGGEYVVNKTHALERMAISAGAFLR